MKPIKITILVDNFALGNLATEHGFSVWIEAYGRNILFDTGQGEAFADNAKTLDVPISKTDILVLSHGHYDHTGGLPFVVENAPGVHIYCHPAVTRNRYSIRNNTATAIGLSDTAKAAFNKIPAENLHWTTEPTTLVPGVQVTGPVPRNTPYEDTGGPFFIDTVGEQADPIEDDMAMWLDTPKGLVVIVGCSHSGVVNILDYIRYLNNGSKIHAVIGGFHLVESSEQRIARTNDALLAIDPDLVVPCHCTGEGPKERLVQALGNRVMLGHAGASFEV